MNPNIMTNGKPIMKGIIIEQIEINAAVIMFAIRLLII